MKFREFLKAWLPVILWIALMFLSSTDLMSAEHTSSFITPFLRWWNPDISFSTIARVHFFVRKAAHLSEYAVLAGLLFRALRSLIGDFWRTALVALAPAVIFAAADEFHQSFVRSRTSSFRDVCIDSAGAIIGILICSIIHLSLTSRRAES